MRLYIGSLLGLILVLFRYNVNELEIVHATIKVGNFDSWLRNVSQRITN